MQTILVAESGSTKTEWRILLKNEQNQQQDTDHHPHEIISLIPTKGISPYFQTSLEILQDLKTNLSPQITPYEITDVYFYGSGCSTEEKKGTVKAAFSSFLKAANINISHDMLACAYALCGREAGIACILGTGANVCLYDGNDITQNTVNLGFWLGDEGSGGFLGKSLVVKYLHNELPAELAEKFEKKYNFLKIEKQTKTIAQVLDNAYKKQFPNRYFGGFAPFFSENIDNIFCRNFVKQSLEFFVERYIFSIKNYQKYEICFTGSVAYVFKEILEEILTEKNLKKGKFIKSPIDELAKYHFE